MSRSGDFRGDNDRQTDRQTDYFTPAHARGVITVINYASSWDIQGIQNYNVGCAYSTLTIMVHNISSDMYPVSLIRPIVKQLK